MQGRHKKLYLGLLRASRAIKKDIFSFKKIIQICSTSQILIPVSVRCRKGKRIEREEGHYAHRTQLELRSRKRCAYCIGSYVYLFSFRTSYQSPQWVEILSEDALKIFVLLCFHEIFITYTFILCNSYYANRKFVC